MSDLIQLEKLPVETLAEMANEAAEASLAQWEECKITGNKAVEHAARCGRALQAIKAQLPHGSWALWVAESFPYGIRRSQQFMEIAKAHARALLTNASSFQDALRLMDDTPEKQARKAEREAKKLEAPPKPLAPATPAPPVTVGTIRHESPPTPQPQPQRPAWLADPDELERPEETDLPPLPKTNTHHTAANRREPDARETDRAGLVSPDDPRDLQDGKLYVWRESANRLFLATPDEIWEAAMEVVPDKLAAHSGATTPDRCDTKKAVEHERDTTPVVDAKPGKVPTVTQLRNMIERRADIGTHRHLWSEQMVKAVQEWAAYKQSLTGKAKVRSLEQWSVALTRIENVVAAQGWPAVADMLEKAIANGWQGWEHPADNGRKSGLVAPHRTYTRLNKPEVKYDELPE